MNEPEDNDVEERRAGLVRLVLLGPPGQISESVSFGKQLQLTDGYERGFDTRDIGKCDPNVGECIAHECAASMLNRNIQIYPENEINGDLCTR